MFVFSLAKELKKTVAEIENTMDVSELMEWVAYYQATDEKISKELKAKINAEKADHERGKEIIAFFQAVTKKKGTKI